MSTLMRVRYSLSCLVNTAEDFNTQLQCSAGPFSVMFELRKICFDLPIWGYWGEALLPPRPFACMECNMHFVRRRVQVSAL